MSARIEWCCIGLKGAFESAGERAFAVLVEPFRDGYAFILQHRALEPDDDGPVNHPRPVSTISEIHIHFCPWCGCRLLESYRPSLAEMVRPGFKIAEPI